ncbi:hypothetical protein [Sulfurospirillum multivorans]|uniref:Periplasmic protein n=2 Tax=Sulfurospirillum multivorans TaxID=66821 RepID=A0AA86AML1_SULMK|nr:hypothetical protein [Sulfurospirillum multivorans]AHJ13024.1 hypothetical protein SMUL_1769 [Sulfurospirillum multivorans DSM 12446]QEH06515.1 hypothetical protein SMN_1750 [Sulfurospirillum multivorans]
MKSLFFITFLMINALFAGEEIVVNGTVRLGVNTAMIGLQLDTKHPESVPVMIDVVRDGKSCLVLAQVERYGLISMSRDLAKVDSIICEGEKPKIETGWVFDENGNLGVLQMLSGTKVKVAFKPDNNSIYTFK